MKDKKAWSGRFSESTNPLVEQFNASVGFDKRLYRHDIQGSIAHATMLGRQKIIAVNHARKIVKGLKRIMKEIETGQLQLSVADEDIHMAVEKRLIEIVGAEIGGKLHTGRSRNDQVATTFRMYVRDLTDEIIHLIRQLQRALYKQAKQHIDTIAPAYTHMQPAQPIRLAHWFLAYYEMLDRDTSRFEDSRKRLNTAPLGSAALAGANFPLDRKWVAKQLGFDTVTKNSVDAVSDRDFAAEFLFATSMTATHLSRLAEELIIFTTMEFGVMELPDAFCTGSSIMPQKKNPDVPELIRGKTGRINGALVAMLTMLKGLPLAYNKDMQEDKEPVFDSGDQIRVMLRLAAEMVANIKIHPGKMANRAEEGFTTAVDITDKLVMAGAPFRDAHRIVGRLTRVCIDNNMRFSELPRAEAFNIDPRLPEIMKNSVGAAGSTNMKDVIGGTARRRIASRLKQMEKEMAKWRI